jgi:hypothetical protein
VLDLGGQFANVHSARVAEPSDETPAGPARLSSARPFATTTGICAC